MSRFSTTQAAKKLGIALSTLSRYISDKKIPSPEIVEIGGLMVHSWTEEEIENVRKLLPKIANGRKTRWQKLREKQKAQPREAVPHKTRKPKKRK
jgi:predicted DNA-binding transcriptional regulator AlpA